MEPIGWDDWMNWGVVEKYDPVDIGVQNMTHDEIVASILDDLLNLHFMGWTVGMPWYEFFRFIETDKQKNRVLEAICDPRVQGLTTSYVEFPQMIRLRPDHDSLQKVMNIAGQWFEGFDIPEGVKVISLTDKGQGMVEEMGVDKASKFVAWLIARRIEK